LRQEAEERMGVVAIHVDLGEHREADLVSERAEAGDFRRVARFLRAELVAREAEDDEAARAVLPVKLLEPLVLRREAALAGGVDDEYHLPLVVGEGLLVAVEGGR